MKEFEITLKVRVEAKNMKEADAVADSLITYLDKEEFPSNPIGITHVEWDLIAPYQFS